MKNAHYYCRYIIIIGISDTHLMKYVYDYIFLHQPFIETCFWVNEMYFLSIAYILRTYIIQIIRDFIDVKYSTFLRTNSNSKQTSYIRIEYTDFKGIWFFIALKRKYVSYKFHNYTILRIKCTKFYFASFAFFVYRYLYFLCFLMFFGYFFLF